MFEPGQKVACTNGKFSPELRDVLNCFPAEGSIYTVRDCVPGIEGGGLITCAILLVGLRNLPNMHGIEPGYHVSRFAEVEEETEYATSHEYASSPEPSHGTI